MRLLMTMGGGTTLSGKATIGCSATGSLHQKGVIGENVPSICPATLLQASNGTLLVATGLGPILRMRRNESTLTAAGVPAPTGGLTILGDSDYSTSAPPSSVPKYIYSTKDYSSFGEVAGMLGSNAGASGTIGNANNLSLFTGYGFPTGFRFTTQGKRSLDQRNVDYNAWVVQFRQQGSAIFAIDANALNLQMTYVGNQLFLLAGTAGSSAVRWEHLTVTFPMPNPAFSGFTPTTPYAPISGMYQAFVRYVDKDGYVSDPSPLSPLATVTDKRYIKYTNVPVPVDPRVVKRQIWRNTTGQVQNFYLDIETDDLTSTTFFSYNTDTQLGLLPVITFTDVDGYTIPYLYGVPPDDKPFIAEMRGRIFGVGTRSYAEGSCQVANGSTTVTGIGTNWSSSFAGRLIVVGAYEYEITAVTSATSLTIAQPYQGADDLFASYVINPYPADQLTLRWSDITAGPEAWPVSASILLPQDGDEITGLINFDEALFILKTRHIYRLGFSEDPTVDGEITFLAKRGCINQACAIAVDDHDCYMLDRQGIHKFTPRTTVQFTEDKELSLPITDIFREETDGLRLNWDAETCFWHATLHQEIFTIKWYVAMAGDLYPRHAICFDYRQGIFWIEEFPRAIAASCQSLVITGRPLLGTTEGKILAADVGSLDLIQPGSTLFTVTAINSPFSLSLDSVPKTCAGVPAVLVTGSAAGEDRTITYQSGTEIQFGTPMAVIPDIGDKIQLGGIRFSLKTAGFDLPRMDDTQPICFEMKIDPNAKSEVHGQLVIFKDGLNTPKRGLLARSQWGSISRNPKTSVTARDVLLSSQDGFLQENLDENVESDIPINYEYIFGLFGSSGEDKPRLLEMIVTGAGE